MSSFFKVKPWRSEKYLQWVSEQPCVCCGRPGDDAHHPIACGLGGGTKCPDYLAIPITRICHNSLHRSPRDWEMVNGSQLEYSAMTMHRAVNEGIIRIEEI